MIEVNIESQLYQSYDYRNIIPCFFYNYQLLSLCIYLLSLCIYLLSLCIYLLSLCIYLLSLCIYLLLLCIHTSLCADESITVRVQNLIFIALFSIWREFEIGEF